MNDYLNSLEPYKDNKEISDLIDEVKKLREYYYTQQYDKMQEHINKLMLKYLAETITWNAIHPIKPITHQEAYINAEVFLRAKGIHSVSDGSKTLSLDQIYNEEFDLPPFDVQCHALYSIKKISPKIKQLTRIKEKLSALIEKEFSVDYCNYQGKAVPISECIDYLSGNSGLTEEVAYQMLHNEGPRYVILSSAAEGNSTLGNVPFCQINGRPLKVFSNQEGLLVNRKGKAGLTRYLKPGMYTLNDDAYILFNKADSPYTIDLRWLGIQYRKEFLSYSSSADNGTWNMTGFFQYSKIDIPDIQEQISLVKSVERIQQKIERIDSIICRYDSLLCKELAV